MKTECTRQTHNMQPQTQERHKNMQREFQKLSKKNTTKTSITKMFSLHKVHLKEGKGKNVMLHFVADAKRV